MARPDPKLFIVWSTKYKYIAEQIYNKLLAKRKEGFPVYPIMFNIRNEASVNDNMYTTLIETMDKASYALILMTPDEEVIRRPDGSLGACFYTSCRPNIYFEYGYLSKHISKSKIFVYNTQGQVPASDISSLIMNRMNVSSSLDEIYSLPNKIVQDLEKYFGGQKRVYYQNLNNTTYEISYKDIFHDFSRDNDNYRFVINNSINLGEYWRYELSTFPEKKDLYHIGRKIIFILERLPFNYLYTSSMSTKERQQVFIDTIVTENLKKNIECFLDNITEPSEYRNYKLYQSAFKMIKVIESYQIKRNNSMAFSLNGDSRYTEESNTLLDIEDYITDFPLCQMLFNRYLALCLHKQTLIVYNKEDVNFDTRKKARDYFKFDNDNEEIDDIKFCDFFFSLFRISMALTHIQKTIDFSEISEGNNNVKLHGSLALFDKARFEYLFEELIEILNAYSEKHNITNPIDCLLNKMEIVNQDEHIKSFIQIKIFINELIKRKLRSKIKKSIDYALIVFFEEIKKENTSLEVNLANMQFISDEITKYILNLNNFDSLYADYIQSKNKETTYKSPDTAHGDLEIGEMSLPNCSPSINKLNSKWGDSTFDIIFKISTNQLYEDDNKFKSNIITNDKINKKVINIIKHEIKKNNENFEIAEIKMIINTKNLESCKQKDLKTLAHLQQYNYNKILDNLFEELKKNISNIKIKDEWENTMERSIHLRHKNWAEAIEWPPNMRSILMYEHYHAKSEKYIFKLIESKNNTLGEIKEQLSRCEECIKNKKTYEECSMLNVIENNYSDYKNLKFFLEKIMYNWKHHNLVINQKLSNKEKVEKSSKNIIPLQKLIQTINYLDELDEIKMRLKYSEEVMKYNYEIPDLFKNIRQKIENALDNFEKSFTFYKKADLDENQIE
ncbi:MAG: TIR domain-containing protein [Eubacteriales bacterium]